MLAAQGARQVVFVGGEPGVGKSRLVGDMAARLHEQGAAVLLGACVPEMGTPYQPFVEPMGALISAVAAGELTIDGSAGMAARRLAALRTMTGTERPESPDGPEHHFTRQLFEDCSEAVLLAARSRPLVIVLEDLQWAGDTALQLLRYLVGHTAESRILIMATLRTSAPDRSADLVSTVGRLYRLDGVRRMDLDGLTTDDIADFLAGVAVASRRDALAAAAVLRDQTGGNPFLLLEVWRELSAHGGLSALRDVDLRAPESVRETVSHRLAASPGGGLVADGGPEPVGTRCGFGDERIELPRPVELRGPHPAAGGAHPEIVPRGGQVGDARRPFEQSGGLVVGE